MDCIRCGQCCLHTPCYLARVRYGLKMGDGCPELSEQDGIYSCCLIKKDSFARRELLETGCHYPEWRREIAIANG